MSLIAKQYPSWIAVATTKESNQKIAEINFDPLDTAIGHILKDGVTFENNKSDLAGQSVGWKNPEKCEYVALVFCYIRTQQFFIWEGRRREGLGLSGKLYANSCGLRLIPKTSTPLSKS